MNDRLERCILLLGLKNCEVAQIIGVSRSTVTRIRNRESEIKRTDKQSEFIQSLENISESLLKIIGPSPDTIRDWIRNNNIALHGMPIHLMKSFKGLYQVEQYLCDRLEYGGH